MGFKGTGHSCDCKRCTETDDTDDDKIRQTFTKLHTYLAEKPPSDDSTRYAQTCLKELDKLLPFSMQMKAKAKVLLASAFGELSQRAAWQENNRGANIIQWTGLDAENQEQRLKDTKKLYETAAKDFEYLLGQDALAILKRLEAGYQPVQDQHKMLSKYQLQKATEAERPVLQEPVQSAYDPPRDCLPPAYDELFKHRQY